MKSIVDMALISKILEFKVEICGGRRWHNPPSTQACTNSNNAPTHWASKFEKKEGNNGHLDFASSFNRI